MTRAGPDRQRSGLRRWLVYGALIVAVNAAVTGTHLVGGFDRLEWIALDYRLRLHRESVPLHEALAVVLVDEASLRAMEPHAGRFPWPRSVYADLLRFLFDYGQAEAVAFDILFAEHHRDIEASGRVSVHDRRLVEDTAAFGAVIHAAQFSALERDERNLGLLDRPLPPGVARLAVAGAGAFPPSGYNSFVLPFPDLARAAAGVGIVGMDPDGDGGYRRVSPLFEYQGKVFPALSLAPLLLRDRGQRVTHDGDAVRIGDVMLPLGRQGRYLFNPVGRYRGYSFSGLLASLQMIERGEVENLLVDPGEFAGKIVYVGADAIGLEDLKATALSPVTPGVLIHAAVASNFLSRDFLRPARPGETAALVALMALLTGLGVARRGRILTQALVPLALVFLYAITVTALVGRGIVLDAVAPAVGAALTWLVAAGFLMWDEQRARRRVSRVLEQYVSPAVLGEVLDSQHDFLLAEVGRRERVTVLFSDVRGFTDLSERLDPEKVVDLLNTYFSAMTEVIFRYRGTVDKFIGDAIMAFWGAPVPDPDHAGNGVAAAVGMQRALDSVNRELEARGYPPVAIGIGLHTGDVVIGNVGSERKLDYTIIGDNVNLASRVEGLTKFYGVPVLITEDTRAALGAGWVCGTIDMVRVKGKRHPARLYVPLATPDDPAERRVAAEREAALLEKGFEAYRSADWAGARQRYSALEPGVLRSVFLKRCVACEARPPEGWDGVFTLHSKDGSE